MTAADRVVNVGSASAHYRSVSFPYIEREVFQPLLQRGVAVLHMDLVEAPGVDLVGDILDPAVQASLLQYSPRVVLCSSCLFNFSDAAAACLALSRLTGEDNYLCLTCPEVYPHCAHPVDNGFRSTPEELVALFPEMRLLRRASIETTCSQFLDLCANPRAALLFLIRLLLPLWKPKNWLGSVRQLPNFFRHYKTSCVLLQRVSCRP